VFGPRGIVVIHIVVDTKGIVQSEFFFQLLLDGKMPCHFALPIFESFNRASNGKLGSSNILR
jgi:hypothetical protein